MIVKMDPEAIRAMAAKCRATADSMELHMASITQSVTQAGWQSQAREEFIMQLAMLQSTTTQTVAALRMMAQAADQKAAQWEAIASVFNGPFHYMSGIWQQVTGFIGGLWSNLTNSIANINWSSLPAWVLPPLGLGIGGAFTGLLPGWDFEKPSWWPFGGKMVDDQAVMGTSTYHPNYSVTDLESLPFSDLYLENESMKLRLKELQDLDLWSKEEYEAKISEIDAMSADYENKIVEIRDEEGKLINKVVRQDGQTLSDKYNQVIDDYESRIESLKEMREEYQSKIPLVDEQAQLETKLQQGEALFASQIGLDQDDQRWGSQKMGGNGNTIDESGCLITSVAMIARKNGADVTPSDVNSYMQSHGGYVKGTSDMYWGSAEKYLESTLGVEMSYKGVSTNDVASVVQSGDPVIIHVKGNTEDGHWVVATSVDSSGNYVVYESGTGQQSTYSPDQLLSGHKAFVTEGD